MRQVVNVELGTDKKTGERYVKYIYSDGTDSFNIGGTRAWRNNNPGNIHCSDPVKEFLKSVGCDIDGFAIFPDYETGNWAMARLLRRWQRYKNLSIEKAIEVYAPPEDGNNTEAYIESVSQKSGLPRTKAILDMTDGEFERFQRAMREVEDSTPGVSLTDFGDGTYYKTDYLKTNKDGSSRDFSNYGPNIPRKYEGFIESTPDGFKTKIRIPVESSNLESIGYDQSTQTLEVEFDSGGIYEYFNVPQNIFEAFLTAPSKGEFLYREIKGAYGYSHVS